MAIKRRKPNKGLIWHTDRGSASTHPILINNYVNKFGIIQSMSGKGNCYDNAVSESFFHTLKIELIHHTTFETKARSKNGNISFIEIWYNRKRLHSYLGLYVHRVEFGTKKLLPFLEIITRKFSPQKVVLKKVGWTGFQYSHFKQA